MYKKIYGVLRLIYHLISRNNRLKLDRIITDLVDSKSALKDRVFVLMVGFSKSGKTTYINNSNVLKRYFSLSSSVIHAVINKEFDFLKDDNSVNGKAYWERQYLTRIIRKKALEKAFSTGLAVVNDSANLNRKERQQRLQIAQKHGYKTTIIWIICAEQELLKRLKKADEELMAKGNVPTWVNLYENVQKQRFNSPLQTEADELIEVLN